MSDPKAPYVERAPGDLLTAEDWNAVQQKVYDDIRATSKDAADGVTHVAKADDADHLEGKDLAALTDEVTKRVLDQVRGRNGYQQLFKILKQDEVAVLEHRLGTCPLVDIYKLEYFEVVCREDDGTRVAFATFYLHHTSERRVRVTDEDGTRHSIDIQPKDFPELGIPFADMLTRYNVEYTDTTSLDDLETEFWKAFFRDPNDSFGDDQYCHSPWFERCCKEQQSVRELKDKGDWNDMVFQMRPLKTINFGGDQTTHPRPANVFVQHLDNNRAAVQFKGPALHDGPDPEGANAGSVESRARTYIGKPEFDGELKVMVLLKV
ncbi:MAG: hypothetical protein ACRDS9_15800 [Pseudonocardiaceae bacterium]